MYILSLAKTNNHENKMGALHSAPIRKLKTTNKRN